jgi:hypothetical protein
MNIADFPKMCTTNFQTMPKLAVRGLFSVLNADNVSVNLYRHTIIIIESETGVVVIKIYTKKFAAQLSEWARGLNICCETVQNGGGCYCIAETENLNELANFFAQLAAINNAALKNQPALRDAVINRMNCYKNIISAQLDEYFKTASYMCLEGFLHFRLWEYSYKIDLLLYAYMKQELKLYGYI